MTLAIVAFLGLGTTEILLILTLFLVLFGAEKIPQIARSLGRLQGEFNRAYRQFSAELEPPEDKAFREQVEFERYREKQVRQSTPEHQEAMAIHTAAEALEIPTKDRPLEEIKRDIAARVGQAPPKGPDDPPATP